MLLFILAQFEYLRNEFHFSEVYQSVNYIGSHAKSMNPEVHCLYLHPFQSNIDKISYISAKIEAVKHLHAVFLLTAEQR